LQGVQTLVVNALRFERPHHSHMLVADAIDFARSIGAQRTYLTHLTHEIGFHDEANSKLPPDVRFAYDGLTIEV
jgi:phosphoribosyl 1,2-cyclic phosphate phosphodiesterase